MRFGGKLSGSVQKGTCYKARQIEAPIIIVFEQENSQKTEFIEYNYDMMKEEIEKNGKKLNGKIIVTLMKMILYFL